LNKPSRIGLCNKAKLILIWFAIEIVPESSTLSDIVNSENERIVTTVDEQELSRIVIELFPEVELVAKDTESYFSVLFQNKNNHWLFRYDVNRKRPTIQFAVAIDDNFKRASNS
jgi:hypothetical protein